MICAHCSCDFELVFADKICFCSDVMIIKLIGHHLSVQTDANLEGAEICLASLFVSILLVNLTENIPGLWRFNQKFV